MRGRSFVVLLTSGMLACTGGSSDGPVDASITDASDPSPIDAAETVLDGAPGPDGTLAIDAGVADAATDAAVDAAIDGSPDAPTTTCGMAPTGNWRGIARVQHNASGGQDYVEADVVWMLISTAGCTDTFRPTGTVRYGFDHSGGSGETQAPVTMGDGTLVIDRTSAIATYTIVGATAPAGEWADHEGAFDGRVLGGYLKAEGGTIAHSWNIVRVDAELVPPGAGCSEPATQTWRMTIADPDRESSAEVTWTRVATTGCEDTFASSGTARSGPRGTTSGATLTYDPDHGPIDPDDGTLVIDRSTAPPSFELVRGSTSWNAQLVYTYPDGRVEREDGLGISIWGEPADGVYDGKHFSARLEGGTSWTFSRD